jgi:hypothetical protein
LWGQSFWWCCDCWWSVRVWVPAVARDFSLHSGAFAILMCGCAFMGIMNVYYRNSSFAISLWGHFSSY